MAYIGPNPKFDGVILTDLVATTPKNPASSSSKIVDRYGALYLRDSAGVEPQFGFGQGELNMIYQPSTAAGATATGAGITVATTTTGSDLPLVGVVNTAVKITPVSGTTDYVYWRFTMPESQKGIFQKIQLDIRALAGYASGDLKLDMYTNSASNYGGSYTRLALTTDVTSVTGLPSTPKRFVTKFTASAADYYELRITRVAGTTALNLCNLIVGPGSTEAASASAVAPSSMIRIDTSNGYGSVGTRVRKFSNVTSTAGTDITYTADATNGDTFTINANGVYAISYSQTLQNIGVNGISLNASTTTDIDVLSPANRLSAVHNVVAATRIVFCGWTGILSATDVVRAHSDTTAGGGINRDQFTIAQVYKF